jgi:hypothetical protein
MCIVKCATGTRPKPEFVLLYFEWSTIYLNSALSTVRLICVLLMGRCQYFFFSGVTVHSGPGSSHYWGFTITLRHATLGRTLIDRWRARRRDVYMTTHNTHKRETCMSPAGFEPTSQKANGRRPTPQTTRPLGSANLSNTWINYLTEVWEYLILFFRSWNCTFEDWQ